MPNTQIFKDKVEQRSDAMALYSIVPPKNKYSEATCAKSGQRLISRLEGKAIDGLIIYDIQDEQSRTSVPRPFPYVETHDGFHYASNHLQELEVTKIFYRSVGKYNSDELKSFLKTAAQNNDATVLAGAGGKNEQVKLTLEEAYTIKQHAQPSLPLGAIMLPERHKAGKKEHERMVAKMQQGCQFFISQAVMDVELSMQILAEYRALLDEQHQQAVPVIFTFTPCSSKAALDFMQWLAISVPEQVKDTLLASEDMIQASTELAYDNYTKLRAHAAQLRLPIGCNIESVGTKKAEKLASLELLEAASALQ